MLTWDYCQEIGIGELGLKPWELKEYTFKEFLLAVKGNALREAREWDRTRNLMFAVIKSQSGKKGPKKAADVMQIPLLDKPQGGDRSELKRKLRLAERHNEYKKKIASDGNAGT